MLDRKTLAQLERDQRALLKKIGQIGPILKGSVSARYTRCGQVRCACQKDPPQLHGPYWQWTTSVNGKTVARRLNDEERDLFQQWVDNRKRLEALIRDMHELALSAASNPRNTSQTS